MVIKTRQRLQIPSLFLLWDWYRLLCSKWVKQAWS